jgi:dihydroorotase
MSVYTLRFSDNTAKTVKFDKEMNINDVKQFLVNEKDKFFTISLNNKLTIVVKKDFVIEFMPVDENTISPSERQWRVS